MNYKRSLDDVYTLVSRTYKGTVENSTAGRVPPSLGHVKELGVVEEDTAVSSWVITGLPDTDTHASISSLGDHFGLHTADADLLSMNEPLPYIYKKNKTYHRAVGDHCSRGTEAVRFHGKRTRCVSLQVPNSTPCGVVVNLHGVIGSAIEEERQSIRDNDGLQSDDTGGAILHEVPSLTSSDHRARSKEE